MKLLDLTLATTEENLALDEALLETAESSAAPEECLRLWESPRPAVVVGRASRVEEEVCVPYCREAGIAILRRCSGGAAVVIGPGCLMYAVVLNCDQRPALRMIEQAHQFVLDRISCALARCQLDVHFQGTSDLTVGDRKISGNSLRCKRGSLLYHGTILYQFSPELIERCLKTPPRQPEYRRGRSHRAFTSNVSLTSEQIRAVLPADWPIEGPLVDWPTTLTARLAAERYARDEWNRRL